MPKPLPRPASRGALQAGGEKVSNGGCPLIAELPAAHRMTAARCSSTAVVAMHELVDGLIHAGEAAKRRRSSFI
jgi:hypothetical protein